jgi:outer membrane lipoprotein-sorting protein
VKRVELLEQPLVSRGRFAFKRPDRVRLEVTEPQPGTLLIRGTEVRIPGMSEADAHAMAMTPTAAMFSRLGALFTGETRALEQDFEVSARADGTSIEVALTPRQDRWQKVLRRIELRFSGPQLLTDKIRIDDSLGDQLEITMLDVQRNVDLPDTLFEP